MKKRWIGLLALAMVAVAALGYTGFAYAQAEEAEWNDFISGTYVPANFAADEDDGDRPNEGVLREYVTAAIAEELGLTAEELEAKKEAGEKLVDIAAEAGIAEEDLRDVMQAAFETAVANALADGAITEEQAERILEHGGKKGPGGHPGNGGPGGKPGGERLEIFMDVNETVLGLTQDEIKERIQAGETFAEIIESEGFTQESYKEAIKAEMIARVDQALAAGEIDQEQADQLIERIENAEGFPGERPNKGNGPGERPNMDLFEGAVEDVLGLTKEEIRTQIEAGDTFEDILDAQGFDTDSFEAAMKTELTDRVNEALAADEITQEQADALLERIENADHLPRPGGHKSPGGKPGNKGPGNGHGPKNSPGNENG
jgi:hypothetical protein